MVVSLKSLISKYLNSNNNIPQDSKTYYFFWKSTQQAHISGTRKNNSCEMGPLNFNFDRCSVRLSDLLVATVGEIRGTYPLCGSFIISDWVRTMRRRGGMV
jgi:hypothetical protein